LAFVTVTDWVVLAAVIADDVTGAGASANDVAAAGASVWVGKLMPTL
jgi:hypothetical protein